MPVLSHRPPRPKKEPNLKTDVELTKTYPRGWIHEDAAEFLLLIDYFLKAVLAKRICRNSADMSDQPPAEPSRLGSQTPEEDCQVLAPSCCQRAAHFNAE
jgi:hypothetical protein